MKNAFICFLFISWLSACGQTTLSFQRKASFPGTARIGTTCFVVDSNLYVIGGVDSATNYNSEVWTYSIKSDTWHRLQDFPGGKPYEAGSFVINGKGYLAEGFDYLGLTNWIWEYTPSTDTWRRKSDFPGGPRRGAVCFAYQGLGYLGFGNSNTDQRDFWQYDPMQDHWTQLNSLPAEGRSGSTIVTSGNLAYLMGGYYKDLTNGSSSEMWRYNTLDETWLQMPSLPGYSEGYGVAWGFGDHIISGFGVHVDSAFHGSHMHTGKYIYNIGSNSWDTLIIQGFRDSVAYGYDFVFGAAGFHFGGYVVSEAPNSLSNELWTFDASALLPTGVAETDGRSKLRLYPNPLSESNALTVSSPGEGTITFTNSIGQLLYISSLHDGDNVIPVNHLQADAGIIFYSAQLLQDAVNGKVVVVK